MRESDWKFYENQQKSPPIGYCNSFLDRKWQTSNKRKLERPNWSKDESYNQTFINPVDSNLGEEFEDPSSDQDYKCKAKKSKYDLLQVSSHKDDTLPFKYCHIRKGRIILCLSHVKKSN